jgi:hypothetical protein
MNGPKMIQKVHQIIAKKHHVFKDLHHIHKFDVNNPTFNS